MVNISISKNLLISSFVVLGLMFGLFLFATDSIQADSKEPEVGSVGNYTMTVGNSANDGSFVVFILDSVRGHLWRCTNQASGCVYKDRPSIKLLGDGKEALKK